MSVQKKKENVPNRMVKALLIGDRRVGKSSLAKREEKNEFPSTIDSIGTDFVTHSYGKDESGATIIGQLWDFQAEEAQKQALKGGGNSRGASLIFLIYSVTNEQSFLNIRKWISKIDIDAQRVLIGNKSDCIDERSVETGRGQALADEYGISFFETSAKSGANVHDAFQAGIDLVVSKPLVQPQAAVAQPQAAPKEEKSFWNRWFGKSEASPEQSSSKQPAGSSYNSKSLQPSEKKKEAAQKPKTQSELAAENSFLKEQIKRLEAEKENEKLKAELAQLKAGGQKPSGHSSSSS